MGASTENPACPRCGYDQSGAIAAWEKVEPAQCPLRGVCTECGDEFAWSDVFMRSRRRAVKQFEVAEHRIIASFFLTTWRALRPWSFWSWADFASPPRWSRLAIGVLGGAITVHMTFAFLYAIAGQLALLIDPPPGSGFYAAHTSGWLKGDLLIGVWPWGRPPITSWPAPYAHPAVEPRALMAFITIAFMNLLFFAAAVSLGRTAALRSIVRAAAYGLIGAPLSHGLFILIGAALALFEAIETRIVGPPEMSWATREALMSFAPYASIAAAIIWWVMWWGSLGARCLHWRRPWLTAIVVALASSLMTLVLFVNVDQLWMWTGEYWQ